MDADLEKGTAATMRRSLAAAIAESETPSEMKVLVAGGWSVARRNRSADTNQAKR